MSATLPSLPGAPRVLWCCLALTTGLLAQDPVARFERAYRDLQAGADPAGQARLAATASDLFLRIAFGDPRRQRLLAAGVEVAVIAGHPDLALERAASGDGRAPAGPLLRWRLHALARTARLAEFVAAMDRGVAAHPEVVAEVLAAEEARLLPAADRALRRGETTTGRAIFEALAALEPRQGWRVANLGLCLRNLGELGAAARAYAEARRLAPADAQIENDYGLFLRATGRGEDARAAFWRSLALDAETPGGAPGSGPAITNLVHHEALAPGELASDPLPAARSALALRPEAAMLRRLVLDVSLARLGR